MTVIFGFVYWLIITTIAFILQFNDASSWWLFKYCVFSMLFAFTLQCCILTLAVVRSDENDKFLRGVNVDAAAKSSYALLLCIDLFVHIGAMFLGAEYIDYAFSWSFVCCHLLSLFLLSMLCFEWQRGDTVFRFINFVFEWIDILSQIAVTLLYSRFSDSDDKDTITKVFWVFTLIQIMFWVPPLAMGTAKSTKSLAKHIILLDVFTDIPLIITTMVSGAYAVQFWIFCDLIVKICLMLRGVVVNLCLHLIVPRLRQK